MIDPHRIRGALYGLAAGDRIGGPIRMALILAHSLIDQGGYNPRDLMNRYVAWWQKDGFDTGRVAARVFDLIAAGVDWQHAPLQVHDELNGLTAGCNPAHRSTPLALAGYFPDELLPELIRYDARLTHYHPFAGDAATVTALVCRALIKGAIWSDALRLSGFKHTSQPLNRGGYAPDVLKAAVHFVDKHDNFEDALVNSLAFAGADNYCPVLVGAIGGARWGFNAIPDKRLSHCKDLLTELHQVSEALCGTWK